MGFGGPPDPSVVFGRRAMSDRPTIQARARIAVRDFGWGPNDGPVQFERARGSGGWRLGNGVVVSVWDGDIPDDEGVAMRAIEDHCNGIRADAGLPALGAP